MTIEAYDAINFEVASTSSFRDLTKRSFRYGEFGDCSGGMNTICSRPKVADDAISGEDVDTFRHYIFGNMWIAIFSSFQKKIQTSHLCNA